MPHIESLDWNLHTHIALDLDETLALSMQDGLDKLHALGKMQNIRTPADITDFLWENIEGSDMTNEELYAFWHTHQLGNVSPITGAIIGVGLFGKMGKNLSIITARNEIMYRKESEKWVHRHFPVILPQDIYFVNHTAGENHPKSAVCHAQAISLIIDDGYHNIIDALENNISCILLDKPWNRRGTLEHPLLYRAKNWEEIIKSLEKYVT